MDIIDKIESNLEYISSYKYLKDIFNEYKIYIAGGFIRNIICDLNFNDVDLFIDADLSNIKPLLEKIKKEGDLTYGPFGSPRWNPFSEDFYYDLVPFSQFIVQNKKLSTIEEILENFDITINAIGYDIRNKKLLNPVDGIQDLENKIIRAVRLDFPDKILESDGIRISTLSVFWFRLLHYKNKFHFEFEKCTLQWINDNRFRSIDLEKFKKMFFTPLIGRDYL